MELGYGKGKVGSRFTQVTWYLFTQGFLKQELYGWEWPLVLTYFLCHTTGNSVI